MKIWLKIALNAVRLPKFEPVNGISWSPRKIMVKDLRNVPGWCDFAHAQRNSSADDIANVNFFHNDI